MVVGSTHPSISKADIFSCLSEAEVLSSVFPEIRRLPCLISSPLRQDRHPSFSVYATPSGSIRYIDFATGEKGDLLSLLCAYWHCGFPQCLQRIADNCNFHPAHNSHAPTKRPKVYRRAESKVEVKVRPWRDYDIAYWQSYGCSVSLLKHCEVYPISHKIIFKDGRKFTFAAPRLSYVFVEHKEGHTTKKIYSPHAKKYKWVTDSDGSVIGLWSKVPHEGGKIVICSSLKDAVCLWSNSSIPCVYIQGEAFSMSQTAISELRRRFRQVFICLDNDEAGIRDAAKLRQLTGFTNITLPPFQGGKDISDFYHVYGEEKFKSEITTLFTN